MNFPVSYLWKVFGGYAALALLCATLVVSFTAHQVERDSRQAIDESLTAQAILLRDLARQPMEQDDDGSFQRQIRRLGGNIGARMTVIRADGVVVADSDRDTVGMDNHITRPEIIDAARFGVGRATRFSRSVGAPMRYVAIAVNEGDRNRGFVRVSFPLTSVEARLARVRGAVVTGAGVATLVALFIGFFLARSVARPLTSMTDAADAMARGEHGHSLPVERADEVGTLARAMVHLSESSNQRSETIAADRNKLQAILSSMVEGVVAVDSEMVVSHMNGEAAKIFGVRPDDCLARNLETVVDAGGATEVIAGALSTQRDVKTERRFGQAGAERVIELHASPLFDREGSLVGAVVVMHDLSELHKLERVRRDFIANVSHELKTPITAIRGLAETMIDDPDMAPDISARFLGKIRGQSERLSSLVTDLLTLSRIESDQERLERIPLDLRSVVESARDSLLATAEQQSVSIMLHVPSAPLTVAGDREALYQVATNLIDNAIKYSPEGGEVVVSLRQESETVIFDVRDSGVGIPTESQARIFERFYRVDKARSRKMGGTGLGLSIVKHVALAHGGNVRVESVPGQGATFIVSVPLAEPEPVAHNGG